MDILYYSFERKTKTYNNLFWILSIISWLCLIVTSFYSIMDIYNKINPILFTIVIYPLYSWRAKDITYNSGIIYPLQMHPFFYYFIAIILSFLSFLSFIMYCILIILIFNRRIIKTNDIKLLNINKYNFIPLFSLSILFLLGECYKYNASRWERRNILGLFFNLISLPTIVIIYCNFKLSINTNINLAYLIKKLGYSCIIAIEWYYLCYITTNIFILYLGEDYFFSIIKYLGFLLPLKFGIGAMIFSFYFKDIIIAFLSSIINLGCSLYFFSIHKIYRNKYNGNLEGIIYVVLSILFFLEVLFLFVNYKKEILK